MRAGAPNLNARTYSCVDNESTKAPLSTKFGWFLVRILQEISKEQIADIRDNHGIEFKSIEMIQPGWFKKFLDEDQVTYIRSTRLFSLIPVKNHDIPDFSKLKNQPELMVFATDEWHPNPPAAIKSKSMLGAYVVTGASAEQLFQDPYVCKIDIVPKVRLI